MKLFKRITISLSIYFAIPFSLNSSANPTTMWNAIMKEQSRLNLSKGITYMSENQYLKASIEFLKAIEKDPSSMAYTMYGASLYWMGDNKSALSNYEKALEIDQKNDIAWQLKGISLARESKLKEAMECFKKSAELNPSRSDVMMNIGSVYFSMNHITQAIKYLKKAIKTDEKNPLYYYQIGLIYFTIGDYDNAIKNFENAYSLKYDYEEAILWLGISHEKNGNAKKAISMYKKAISLKPRDFFARYRLVRISGELKEIIPCFELTPQKNNGSIPMQISYSANNFKKTSQGENPAIKALYDNLMTVAEDERAYISVNIVEMENITLEKKKEWELSKKLSEKFKPVSYRIVTKNYTFDGSENKQKETEKIISDIEKTLENKSNYRINFDIHTSKINTKGNQSLAYAPRDVGNDMGLWIIGNPWITLIEEDTENREEEKNNSKIAINALGMLLIGEIETAKNEFKKIINLMPEIASLGLGVIDYLNGNKTDAFKRFEDALKINPKNETAKKNMRWINGNQ